MHCLTHCIIPQIGTVVKHMNITTLARAVGLYHEACNITNANPVEAAGLLHDALHLFDSVTAGGLNDMSVFLMAAAVWPVVSSVANALI